MKLGYLFKYLTLLRMAEFNNCSERISCSAILQSRCYFIFLSFLVALLSLSLFLHEPAGNTIIFSRLSVTPKGRLACSLVKPLATVFYSQDHGCVSGFFFWLGLMSIVDQNIWWAPVGKGCVHAFPSPSAAEKTNCFLNCSYHHIFSCFSHSRPEI